MDKLQQWVALTVAGSLALLAAGWFLVISPKKDEATELRTQAAAQVSANAMLETQLQVLRAQAKDLPSKQAELAQVAAKIPDNPSLPALIRALTAASTSAGIDFVSVTPGAPVAVVVAAPAAPQAPESATSQTTPTTPTTPTGPTAAGAGVAGPAGTLATIPVALNVVGDYFDLAQFVSEVENLPRALRVLDLAIAPGVSPTAAKDSKSDVDNGRSLATTINGTVFMAVNRPVATAVVAPPAAPAK
ncbi:MAG: type 4a pilus biogenesis protein PilO [Actinomycetota bacterium]|nr:type 4a pilus biogenesis protein PilO [Actinomycetota bacterium]